MQYLIHTKPVVAQAARAAARLLCGATLALSCTAAQAAEVGVFRWNSPEGPSQVDGFSQWLGNPVTVATAFEARTTWDDITGADWNLAPWSNWVRAQHGRNIALAVPMLPASGASLASCAAGQYDGYWAKFANNLAYYGLHWAYLRLGWEMDGGWYAWNAKQGSGKEASFAGCFRRIVQTMRKAQPANQWKFVLNTAANFSSKSYLDAVWPGDDYVDVVAIDFYDASWLSNTYPYPSPCDAACRTARQQRAWDGYSWRLYAIRDFAVARGKHVALPEWGIGTRADGHAGGDNPGFIRKVHAFIQDPANQVAFHGYWDVNAPDFQAQLSGTTKFPESAAAFKQVFGPGNSAPRVSFSAPAAGQTVKGTVTYAASASDDAGVSRVEFSVGSTSLASDSASPYGGSLDTTKLANGTHVLRATAYDAQGLSATAQVAVNVQNVAPSGPTGVTFSAPAANATISGSFSDSAGCQVIGTGITRVVFSMDNTPLNTENLAPWQCKLDTRQFANGSHTLRAVVYNAAGASSIVTRTVNVQNGPVGPTGVSFTAPAANATLSGSYSDSTACQLTGTGISRVVFSMDNTQLNTENLAPWQCKLDTRSFANGTHTLRATAYNSAGGTTTVMRSVNVRN